MAYLVLVRHGQSTYNKQGLWAGKTDVPLTEEGMEEARTAGREIISIDFDIVYVTNQMRTQQTWVGIEEIIKDQSYELRIAPAFRERDYGDLTGKNKWEAKEEMGEELWQKVRRGWNVPIPKGETLKDVYERVIPYYKETVLSELKEGKNILIVASGNSLRALVKHLDNIADEDVSQLEIATGGVYVYEFDKTGKIISKELRGAKKNKV